MIDALNPSHFDWLELAEEFYKLGKERTVPVREAGELKAGFMEIEGEYRDLKKMHEIAPDNVIEPLQSCRKDGDVQGYHMERFDGEKLREVLDRLPEKEALEVYQELEATVENFHENGVYHGDLNGNVLYSEEEGIKIFDPVGAGYEDGVEWLEGEADEESMSSLYDGLRQRDCEQLRAYAP